MSVDAEAFLERWHRIVAEKDVAALADVLADDVTLGPPPYWEKFEGVELVQHLLGIIVNTIDDFTYRREWIAGSERALEFTGRVDDLELQGVDLISLDGDNRLKSIEVAMRPANAVQALQQRVAPQMVEFLKSRAR
jgi:hypothetical protein